ncbi:TPA: hypothetical protein JAV82_002651 [Kluyvera ascorbata]|nr:hypothetical protein [Kluyvera ascorbata]
MTINLTNPANHPANGPLTVERITRVRDELQRTMFYASGGVMDYIVADAIKGLDELLVEKEVASKPVGNEELDQMIWKLERDGMTPKMLSLMRELREVRRAKPVTLSVWYGAMPETNGRENWTAMLHRKGAHPWEGIMIDRSEYPGRALYEADRMRFLIGEIDVEPDILAYDSETHSGYVEKLNQPVSETNKDE